MNFIATLLFKNKLENTTLIVLLFNALKISISNIVKLQIQIIGPKPIYFRWFDCEYELSFIWWTIV